MKGNPTPTDEQARKLWRLLSDGNWHKAKDLAPHMGNTRIIRAICEAKPEHFVSTQAGYKLTRYATDDELMNARNDLLSRCKKMQARAEAIDAELYRRSVPEQMRVGW